MNTGIGGSALFNPANDPRFRGGTFGSNFTPANDALSANMLSGGYTTRTLTPQEQANQQGYTTQQTTGSTQAGYYVPPGMTLEQVRNMNTFGGSQLQQTTQASLQQQQEAQRQAQMRANAAASPNVSGYAVNPGMAPGAQPPTHPPVVPQPQTPPQNPSGPANWRFHAPPRQPAPGIGGTVQNGLSVDNTAVSPNSTALAGTNAFGAGR